MYGGMLASPPYIAWVTAAFNRDVPLSSRILQALWSFHLNMIYRQGLHASLHTCKAFFPKYGATDDILLALRSRSHCGPWGRATFFCCFESWNGWIIIRGWKLFKRRVENASNDVTFAFICVSCRGRCHLLTPAFPVSDNFENCCTISQFAVSVDQSHRLLSLRKTFVLNSSKLHHL